MTALISKPGITSASTLSIPKDWDKTWFRNFIQNLLKGADVRNAIGVNGITISGNIASPYATIGISGPATIPGLITFSGGINVTPVANTFYQTGSFTATVTGCTTTVTGTAFYVIIGGICFISLAPGANITGTSNSTSMTVTGLPAVCQPATQFPAVPCTVEDNTAFGTAYAELSPGSGTITFFRQIVSGTVVNLTSTGFTASGTKGLDGTVLIYPLK
jgi:hypothetical protein